MLNLENFFGTESQFPLLQVFIIILLTGIFHALSSKILSRLLVQAEKTRIIYDQAFLQAIKNPLSGIIWLVGISIAINILTPIKNDIVLLSYLPQIKKIGFIVAISYSVIRFIQNVSTLYIKSKIKSKQHVDETLVHATSKLLVVSVVLTSALAIMQVFGLPISGLLAFGGIGGAGIAFAAKDLLANFFGGFIVYLDRPFKVGDWIRSPDKNIEGTVEYIGWRVTHIRTFDKRPLYVPNGIFLNISVENPSRMRNRRIKTTISLRYQDFDKVDKITDQIKEMLLSHPEIDTKATTFVNLIEFGPSALNIMIYTFTKTTDWIKFQNIQHEIFMLILQIIKANKAECAFPTHTLHIQKEGE